MQKNSLILWAGFLTALSGLTLLCSWMSLYSFMFRKIFVLSKSSPMYEPWRNTVYPIIMDVYLFNCTNSNQTSEEDFKPDLVQIGPYRFIEQDKKVNITWNENRTVSYRVIRNWYFEPEGSVGSLQDNVTVVNNAALVASIMTKDLNFLQSFTISTAVRMFGSVWTTKTVRDLIYGYNDPLIALGEMFPVVTSSAVPTDKVGLLYDRNNSARFEGVFNVHTGEDDLQKMGSVSNWNYKNHTKNFEGECGKITGSGGEFYGSVASKEEPKVLFLADVCRDLHLDYAEENEVNGVLGYRYELGKADLDNGTSDSRKRCNCGGDCLPQGVINITKCLRDTPHYVSFPHFLDADPVYRQQVRGMNPDPQQHRFHMTLEPNTGIVLEYFLRLQYNILLQPNSKVRPFRDVPTVMVPTIWIEKLYTIPKSESFLLQLSLIARTGGMYFAAAMLAMGILLLVYAITPGYRREREWFMAATNKRFYLKKKHAKQMPARSKSYCLKMKTEHEMESPEELNLLSSEIKDVSVK